jgi:ATP diphosphatase
MSASAGARFDRLVAIMHTLRGPNGCPWDREQTLQTLRRFVLEETCEMLDAIDDGDIEALREELGDYVFEAVFLAELCAEAGHFSIADSLDIVTEKLIRRHPHIFTADGRPLADAPEITATEVKATWDEIKAGERAQGGKRERTLLGGLPRALPALHRAHEVGRRAATVGFDWPHAAEVLDKIDEETLELRQAVAADGAGSAAAEDELGDMLFAVANLARKMGIDPETALRKATDKFQARFEAIETAARERNERLQDLTLEELDRRWNAAKETTKERRVTKGTKDGAKG